MQTKTLVARREFILSKIYLLYKTISVWRLFFYTKTTRLKNAKKANVSIKSFGKKLPRLSNETFYLVGAEFLA